MIAIVIKTDYVSANPRTKSLALVAARVNDIDRKRMFG
jgi:hypothetical protein